jgi:CheY-like chemotaxis protein
MNPGTYILVVNDRESWLHLISDVLEAAGFVVSGTTSGARALADCQASSPALILLDYHLGSGVTASDYLASFERLCPRVPIGIVSATDTSLSAEQLGVRFFVPLDVPPPDSEPCWSRVLLFEVRKYLTSGVLNQNSDRDTHSAACR